MIRDLMVHLDGSDGDLTRLGHADALCAAFGTARVTGLYVNPLPEYGGVLGAASGLGDLEPVLALERDLRRMGDETARRLESRLRRPDACHELRRIDDWPSRIPAAAASAARWADLFVATIPQLSNRHAWQALYEAVLFESGRPLFAVPPVCPARAELRTVLVAWNDSAQAVRALNGALPFLRRATRTVILTVEACEDEDDRGAADLAAHLDRHAVRVEVTRRRGSDAEAAGLIRAEAATISADLIVMGAYGHSRLREWVLGGASADVMDATDVPLLMAH